MKRSKKQTIVISCLIAVLFITPLAVLAVLYLSELRSNNFTPAEANVQVRENQKPTERLSDEEATEFTWPAEPENNAYSISKQVEIYDQREKNDEYLRVRFVPSWHDASDNVCGGIAGLTDLKNASCSGDKLLFKNKNDQTVITLTLADHWDDHWTFDPDDGCFYYDAAITPGDISQTLLSDVTISKDVYDLAKDYTLQIDVLADAVQTCASAKETLWQE